MLRSPKIKYIKLQNGDVILFPQTIEHDAFKQMRPVSAGFCCITEDSVTCYGESHSLNLKADEKQDSLDATKQFIGIEAMLKLMEEQSKK